MIELTAEEKTFAKVSGIDERIYLGQKIADFIMQQLKKGAIIDINYDVSGRIYQNDPIRNTLTLSISYYGESPK